MSTARDRGEPEPTEEDVRLADAAARRHSAIEQGRRIGGLPGAMMAGAMIAVRDIIEPPRDDRPVAEVEAPGDPHDVDRDGVTLRADDVGGDADVVSAPLPARPPVVGPRRRRRRR